MRRFDLLILDVALLCLSAILALALHDNFEISLDRFIQFLPYFCVSTLTAACVFFAGRVDCTVWRYHHIADHVRLSRICRGCGVFGGVHRLRLQPPRRSRAFPADFAPSRWRGLPVRRTDHS